MGISLIRPYWAMILSFSRPLQHPFCSIGLDFYSLCAFVEPLLHGKNLIFLKKFKSGPCVHNELKRGKKSILALLASRAKINGFWNFFEWRVPKAKGTRMKKKFQKTLILALEVIVQPPKHTFETGFFSF